MNKSCVVEPCGCVRWLFGREYCQRHQPKYEYSFTWLLKGSGATRRVHRVRRVW